LFWKTFSEVLDKAEEKGILKDKNLIFDFIEEGAIFMYRVPQL
jgi:hypothetical protein